MSVCFRFTFLDFNWFVDFATHETTSFYSKRQTYLAVADEKDEEINDSERSCRRRVLYPSPHQQTPNPKISFSSCTVLCDFRCLFTFLEPEQWRPVSQNDAVWSTCGAVLSLVFVEMMKTKEKNIPMIVGDGSSLSN